MKLANAAIHRFRVSQCTVHNARSLVVLGFALAMFCGTAGFAQDNEQRSACDTLLPDTSQLFISVPEPTRFRELWRRTELGKMFNDEAMEPFAKDLRQQIDAKLAQTDARLGLKLSDLEGVSGGEMAFAMVQPQPNGPFVVVMLADVTGRDEQVAEVSKKVRAELQARDGKSQTIKLDQKYEVSEWTFPPNQAGEERKAYFATHDNWYVSSDDRATLLSILHRIDGEGNDVLAKLPTYEAVMNGAQANKHDVQLRWFMDPFGLAESVRAADVDRERGRDRMKILKEQGFEAIEGVGGVLLVAADSFDFVAHTFVYAPQDKRVLAARMLTFPTEPSLDTPSWAMATFSGLAAFNWDMKTAFEAAKPLVDAMAGSENVFEDALRDIATDPNGLRIDIRKEIIARLGTRVYMASQSETPITPQSEQRLIAFELTDAKAVAKTLLALKKDPTITERTVVLKNKQKHLVWEIQSKANAQQGGQRGGFQQFRRNENNPAPNQARKRPLFKNGALTVAHGYLIYSSDVKFLSQFLTKTMANEHKPLSEDPEFREVEAALQQLDGQPSPVLSSFVRLETALEPNYELFRLNKMPQNESFIGQLLNAFLAPEDEDVSRKQIIDGSSLPAYKQVRQYMLPGGFKAYAEQDGWRIVGCILAREQRAAARQD